MNRLEPSLGAYRHVGNSYIDQCVTQTDANILERKVMKKQTANQAELPGQAGEPCAAISLFSRRTNVSRRVSGQRRQ